MITLSSFFVALLSSFSFAGQTTAPLYIDCPAQNLPFVSMDYLQAQIRNTAEFDTLVNADKWQIAGSIQYIGFFGLSESFLKFTANHSSNSHDFTSFNMWQEAPSGLSFFPIEDLDKQAMTLCGHINKKLFVAIQTENKPNYRINYYDSKLRNATEIHYPLQWNLMMTRAWLSQFSDDSELIFQILIQLYQKDLLTNKSRLAKLKILFEELIVSSLEPKSICDTSLYVQEALKRKFHKDCAALSDQDLASVEELEVIDQDRQIITFSDFELRKSDLVKLVNLKSFKVSNVLWFGTVLIEGYFDTLRHLSRIEFNSTYSLYFQSQGLPRRQQLDSLIFRVGSFSDIKPGFFKNAFSKDGEAKLQIDGMVIDKFDNSITVGLEPVRQLTLNFPVFNGIDLSRLTNLGKLEIVDYQLNSPSRVTLKSGDFPRLSEIDLSKPRAQRIILSGRWSQLKNLSLSVSAGSSLEPGFTFKEIPNIETLDLSANAFSDVLVSKTPHESGFSNLVNLKTLVLLDTHFLSDYTSLGTGGGKAYLIDLITKELPPNVERVDFCLQDWNGDNVRIVSGIFKELAKQRSKLQIRTKNVCDFSSAWINVTY